MSQQAIGMIETKGLCALLEAGDAALKAANVGELVSSHILARPHDDLMKSFLGDGGNKAAK